jgi:hypothetical protein
MTGEGFFQTLFYGKSNDRARDELRLAEEKAAAELRLTTAAKRTQIQLDKEEDVLRRLRSADTQKAVKTYVGYGGIAAAAIVTVVIILRTV